MNQFDWAEEYQRLRDQGYVYNASWGAWIQQPQTEANLLKRINLLLEDNRALRKLLMDKGGSL